MLRRNTRVFIVVLIIVTLAALVVLPIEEGTLFKKGVRLGLDLQGGVHIVYQADMSSIEPGQEDNAIEGAVAILENRIKRPGGKILWVTGSLPQRLLTVKRRR